MPLSRAGKSSFIEMATGITGIVGHSLESKTNEISVIKLSLPDSDIYFVDTPGFDDTKKSDVDIFKMISDWLLDTYKRRIQLTGLLYVHRITDNRMAGTALRNFHVFEQLCGESFNNIVLTTTMWGKVESEEEGTLREKELTDNYWKAMIERGSSVKRFLYTRESALDVLGPIFEEVNRRRALLLQEEMTELKMQIKEIWAGKTLYLELEELVGRQQTMLGKIRGELHGESKLGPDELRLLMEEYGKASAQLQRATEDLQKMKITVGERIRKLTFRIDWLRMFSIFSAMKKRKILVRPDPESNQSLHGGIGSSPQRQDNVQLPNLVGNDGQIMVDKENELAQSGQIYEPGFKVPEEDDEANSVKYERQEPVPPPDGQSQGGTYGQQEEQDGSGTQQEEQGQLNKRWSDWDSDAWIFP